jgi:hypothetical protein
VPIAPKAQVTLANSGVAREAVNLRRSGEAQEVRTLRFWTALTWELGRRSKEILRLNHFVEIKFV